LEIYKCQEEDLNWDYISIYQPLSEAFIEKWKDKVDWDYISVYQILSEAFIKKWQHKVSLNWISIYQPLSEAFIEKWQDKVNWYYISMYQSLSETFIEKWQDKVDWFWISAYQLLSEAFIEKWKDKVNWYYISMYQSLSETFIEKWQHKVNWDYISEHQILSEAFIEKWKDRLSIKTAKAVNKKISDEEKVEAIKAYAEKWNLKFEDGYLYAFREHDRWGRGAFKKNIFYKKGNTYRDWHCDMREDEKNSFGLGIWPKGNTAVRVHYKDFGVAVLNDKDGKARVWAFEVL